MTATFDFSGKEVFVFGDTSGITLAIAKSFASSADHDTATLAKVP